MEVLLSLRKTVRVCAVLAAALLISSGCGRRSSGSGSGLLFPRVLILTTGTDGSGTLPAGANVAMETFNRLGAQTWIGNKSFLLEPERLARYRIIIAPTVYGYHDGDRIFSLAYMDETMLANLADWVEQGGILIAGENVGRNTIAGEDRVVSDGLLDEVEWPLARVFGYRLAERNMTGYRLTRVADADLVLGYGIELVPRLADEWILVPDLVLSGSVEVQACWRKGGDSVPGVTVNRFGQGHGVYVSAFGILHPSIAGGRGDVPGIVEFYEQVFELAFDGAPPVHLNPWPDAARAAVAVTMDDGGDLAEFERTLVRLFGIPRVKSIDLFVCGEIPQDVLAFVRADSRVRLANHSQTHPFFDRIDYTQTDWEIARAESWIGRTGMFRYPYVSPSPAGMFVLSNRGYRVESSIRIDHRQGYAGALFPYNLPVFKPGCYCLTTDVLELSPVLSDWPFYGDGVKHTPYPEERQRTDARMFRAGLDAVWQEIIRPGRGMMVMMGHPMYMGHSDVTLEPVISFLKDLEPDAWVSDLNGIHDWWRTLENVEIRLSGDLRRTRLHLVNHNPDPVPGLTFRIPVRDTRARVKATGVSVKQLTRNEEDGEFLYLVFELDRVGEVEVTY